MASVGTRVCVELWWRDTNIFIPIIMNAWDTRQQAQTNLPIYKGNRPWGQLCTIGSCFYPNWDSFCQHSSEENMCFLLMTFLCEL